MVLQVMNGVKVMRMKSLSLLVAVLAGGVLGTEHHGYAKPASSGNASGSDFANADIGCYEFRPNGSMLIIR